MTWKERMAKVDEDIDGCLSYSPTGLGHNCNNTTRLLELCKARSFMENSYWAEERERMMERDRKMEELVERAREKCACETPKIVLESAGVDPDHQTDHCDFCGKPFEEEDEGIQTCTHYRHVTLCEECYRAAGNRVR